MNTIENKSLSSDLDKQSLWLSIQNSFRREFGEDNFNAWLSKINLVSFSRFEIILATESSFIKDWIAREFLNSVKKTVDGEKITIKKGIKDIINSFLPEVVSFDFLVDKTLVNEVIAKQVLDNIQDSTINLSANNNLFNIGVDLNPEYTFENFVVGKTNKLAYSIAKNITEEEKNYSSNPLFIYGGVGLGKTHLCQAVAWKLKELRPTKQIIYLSAEKFMFLFVQALQNQDITNFKNRFRNVDTLIIDDIHFIAGKESTQNEFFHTFNTLISENKQIILACDKSPVNLQNVDEKLKSRMSGGIVVDVLETDEELRYNFIKEKSKKINLNLSNEMASMIAKYIERNIRELDGCLKRLLINQNFMSIELNKENITEILKEELTRIEKAYTIDNIQKKVSDYYNIKITDLKSKNRSKDLVLARHIAMYLSRKLTNKSLPDIAKKFNSNNHATVLHAVKKIEVLLEDSLELTTDYNNIMKRLD